LGSDAVQLEYSRLGFAQRARAEGRSKWQQLFDASLTDVFQVLADFANGWPPH
jgi:hypothetical protein